MVIASSYGGWREGNEREREKAEQNKGQSFRVFSQLLSKLDGPRETSK